MRRLGVMSLVVLFALVVLSFTLPLHAASGINLITSPLPVNLVAKPGTSITTDLRVQNGGTSPEALKVSLMKFSAYGEEGTPYLADRAPADSYFDWVSFSPAVFTAPPGQWQTVKMTINLPTTAAFGYYYAVVFSRAEATAPIPGKANAINGSTAILVLLDADVPNANRSLQLTSFTASHHFYEFLPVDFSIKLHNNGNLHLQPFGNIFITHGKQQVASLDINPGSGNILPGTNRIFTPSWRDGFPVYQTATTNGQVAVDKAGHPVQKLTWGLGQLAKLRFGHYTAKLALAYDNGHGDVPLEATLSFWVIPWRGILVVVAVPIIPALLVYLIMKRKYRRRRP